jgi:hypothetical protein
MEEQGKLFFHPFLIGPKGIGRDIGAATDRK